MEAVERMCSLLTSIIISVQLVLHMWLLLATSLYVAMACLMLYGIDVIVLLLYQN